MVDEEKWKVESDVRTLKEAEMIKADSDRMKKAMGMMDEEMKAMMKIAVKSIEDHAKERFPKTYPKSGE